MMHHRLLTLFLAPAGILLPHAIAAGQAPTNADTSEPAATPALTAEEQVQAVFDIVEPSFRETPVLGWLGFLGSILAALVIGKVVTSWLRAMAANREERHRLVGATVLRNIAGPLGLALLTVGLVLGLNFIHTEAQVNQFMRSIITLLFLFAVGWCLYNLVEVIERVLANIGRGASPRLDRMVPPMIRKSLRVFLVIIFSLVIAQNIFGLNVTGWLAGLGLVGLALSLASQDSVKNFFGSITVFLDRPFTVGDVISFAGATGTVEEIGLRSTRIRVANGNLITVPNMKFIDGTVENFSRRPAIRRDFTVTIKHEPTRKPAELVGIIRAVLHDPQVTEEGHFDMTEFPPRVHLDGFNGDSLIVKASYWYQIRGDGERELRYFQHMQMVNQKLLAALEAGQVTLKQIA